MQVQQLALTNGDFTFARHFDLGLDGGYFLLIFLYLLAHSVIAHCFVLGGVRLKLRTVSSNVFQRDQVGILCQPNALVEQLRKCWQMPFSEIVDRVVIRMLIAGDHSARQDIKCCLLYFARRFNLR